MNDSFFGRSGTLQQSLGLAGALKGMQSSNSMDRVGSLGKIVQFLMGLLG